MAEISVSLSEEELRHLEELGQREGVSVAQLLQAGIRELLHLPEEAFRQAAQRVLKKN